MNALSLRLLLIGWVWSSYPVTAYQGIAQAAVSPSAAQHPALTLEDLGWSVGWAEAMSRYSGFVGVYRFRTISSAGQLPASYRDGIVRLAWADDAVSIDTLREECTPETWTQAHLSETFLPLRGEYVSFQLMVGGGVGDAFVACSGPPPGLAVTLMGQLTPEMGAMSCQLDQTARATEDLFSNRTMEVRLTTASLTPLPDCWTIHHRSTVEHVAFLNSEIDGRTRRIVPSVIVESEYTDGRLDRAGVWQLWTDPVFEYGVPSLVQPGALVTDFRPNETASSKPLDRSVAPKELVSWVGIPSPLPNRDSHASALLAQPTAAAARIAVKQLTGDFADPLRGSRDGPARNSRPIDDQTFRVLGALGVTPSFAESRKTYYCSYALPGLPSVTGELPVEAGQVVLEFGDIGTRRTGDGDPESALRIEWLASQRRSAGTAKSPVLEFEQRGNELRALASLMLRPTSTRDCGKQLTGIRSGCGLELLNSVPLRLGDGPIELAFEMSLRRPWPQSGRLAVQLMFDDGSSLAIPISPQSVVPPISFDPLEVGADNNNTLVARSEHPIVSWRWYRIPGCLQVFDTRKSEHERAWRIQPSEGGASPHLCSALLADVGLQVSGSEEPVHVVASVPIAHRSEVHDRDGRLLMGGLFDPGEHVALMRSPLGSLTLVFPDRVPCITDQLTRRRWTFIDEARVPNDHATSVVDWIPEQQPNIRVCGRIAGSIRESSSLWAHVCR